MGGPAHESHCWTVLNPDLRMVIMRGILSTAWKLMTPDLQKAFLNSSVLGSKDNLCFSRVKHSFSSFLSLETPFQVSKLVFWSWLRHQARELGFYSQAYANTGTLVCFVLRQVRVTQIFSRGTDRVLNRWSPAEL